MLLAIPVQQSEYITLHLSFFCLVNLSNNLFPDLLTERSIHQTNHLPEFKAAQWIDTMERLFLILIQNKHCVETKLPDLKSGN